MENNELHVRMLSIMEEIRREKKDFFYGLRVQKDERNKRLERGFFFQGNESYIFVPICSVGSGVNKTRCMGLCLQILKDGFRSYIEVVYDINSMHSSSKYKDCFEEIMQSLPFEPDENESRKKGTIFTSNVVADVDVALNNLKEYFIENYEKIMLPLVNYGLAIDKQTMEKGLQKNATNIDGNIATRLSGKKVEFISDENYMDDVEDANDGFPEEMEKGMVSVFVKDAKRLLDNAGQIILQGAPGCGKTYVTTDLAVYLCNGWIPADRQDMKKEYKRLQKEGRIAFTTFHQSLDYEEFVEGLKPDTSLLEADAMRFVVKDGIFKRVSKAAKEKPEEKFVLIIDEINRANISKVLGELITLLEKSKRLGNDDEFTVTLPYSGEEFGVPNNLYIIGTMNTADRSLGYIDYAIRRRFAFITLKAERNAIDGYSDYKADRTLLNKALALYDEVNVLVRQNIAADFEYDDIMVGHSYFMAPTVEELQMNLDYKIRPLLEEYFRDGILVDKGELKKKIQGLSL